MFLPYLIMSLRSNDQYYVMTLWAFGFEAIGVIEGSNFKLLCSIPGGGGTIIFSAYVGSDPASTVHPK